MLLITTPLKCQPTLHPKKLMSFTDTLASVLGDEWNMFTWKLDHPSSQTEGIRMARRRRKSNVLSKTVIFIQLWIYLFYDYKKQYRLHWRQTILRTHCNYEVNAGVIWQPCLLMNPLMLISIASILKSPYLRWKPICLLQIWHQSSVCRLQIWHQSYVMFT